MKMSKMLAKSILSSSIMFFCTTNTYAEDLVFNFGSVRFEIKGIDFDDYEGPGFEQVLINGVNLSDAELLQLGDQLDNLENDNDTINIGGQNVTFAQIKQGVIDLISTTEFAAYFKEFGLTDEQIQEVIDVIRQNPDAVVQALTSNENDPDNPVTKVIAKNSAAIRISPNIALEKYIIPMVTATINYITDLNDSRTETLNQHMVGIASGDEPEARPGVWVKGMLGRENYKFSGNKFKTKTYSGAVGIDFKVTDELLIGGAFGYQERRRLKGSKGKDRLGSGSVYGIYYFNNGLFTNLQYSYGRTILSGDDFVASILNKTNIHLGTAKLGYNFIANDAVLFTPTIGIRYGILDNKTKKDTQQNTINLKLNRGTFTHALAGLKISTKVDLGGTTLLPYVRGGIEHLIADKKTKLVITNKQNNVSSTFKFTNSEKNRLIAGVGATAVIHNFELGAEYTFSKTKIYRGHLGTLNLRVNF